MQIQTPDIGVDKALVAEILVKVGDHVAVDDSLLVLESDKATVEVPSTKAGIVKNILVQQGDQVTEGVALIELEDESQTAESPAQDKPESDAAKAEQKPVVEAEPEAKPAVETTQAAASSQVLDVKVPDIGVDKATVEVPSTVAGIVESVQIKEGDSVKEGVVLIQVKTTHTDTPSEPETKPDKTQDIDSSSTETGKLEITVPDLGV